MELQTNNGAGKTVVKTGSYDHLPEHKRPAAINPERQRVRISQGENWVFAFADIDNRVTGLVLDRFEGPNGFLYAIHVDKACEVVAKKKNPTDKPAPFVVPAGSVVFVGENYDMEKLRDFVERKDADGYQNFIWTEIWYREKIALANGNSKWQIAIDIEDTGKKRPVKAGNAEQPF